MRERGGVMRLYRCANNLHKMHIPFIPKVISRIIRIVFSADIPYQTEIGIGTQLAHNGLGVVINQDSRIGKNCKILQNVTIGGRGEGNGVPIIEDNVLIGAGAAILGGVKIGRGAKIGANAVVVKDVPENATVVGIPAKII